VVSTGEVVEMGEAMRESRLGTGEIFGKINPDFRRRFAIFQIAGDAIEARFEDGSRPVRVDVRRMVLNEVMEALKHALAAPVNLDCPRLAGR
jgi:hypothetical protein